jgi:beta-1,4-N-acetylglucosaminyltransferase
MPGAIFITVGTTEFDQLIEAIDNLEFLVVLRDKGFTKLTIQLGRGTYEPSCLLNEASRLGIELDVFRFKPTLDEDMSTADLIVSHCGAGSILEAVKNRKLLVVVVNETLQDNHQTDLADAMTAAGCCYSTSPQHIVRTLREAPVAAQGGTASLQFPINNSIGFCKAITSMFDFVKL